MNDRNEDIAKLAFRLSQALDRPDALQTERGLWALHDAHEALKTALRDAGFYGKQFARAEPDYA